MGQRKKQTLSFLLRLWRAGNGEKPTWRASLEDALTRERVGFAGLKEMFDYLEVQIKEVDRPGEGGPGEVHLTVNIRIDAEITKQKEIEE